MSFDLTSFAAECNAADPEKFSVMAEKLRDIVLEVNKSFNLTRITDIMQVMETQIGPLKSRARMPGNI